MDKIPSLETSRLLLRKIDVKDAPFFFELFNSAGWLTYIGDRNIKTIADAEKQIKEKYLPSYNANGYGSYLVVEKASHTPIGTCGMYKRANLNHPDIGFAFLPAYMNIGYGYESAKAVLENAKANNTITKILAFTLPQNKASIRLLEKLGLRSQYSYFYEDNSEELILFST